MEKTETILIMLKHFWQSGFAGKVIVLSVLSGYFGLLYSFYLMVLK